jgi:NAD(P)-dependent dehydrogenase (short-subunit alcohol dehydrogenase family)
VDIAGKVAVVTGAGRDGSGRAIARRLALGGATVVVSDINETGALDTVRQIEQAGGHAAFRACDVRSEEQVRQLIAFAEATFGNLAIMVNNASAPVHFDEPLEHWADAIQTDLFGAIYGTRLAIDAMRRSGGGAIVNMSSISALWHGRKGGAPAFDVAKAGVIRLTTTLGWLAEKEHIRVNCLAPGWIASAEVRAFWEPLTPEQRRERGAPQRLLQLDQVADTVVRLVTDESLAGRVLVWWSDDSPGLIPWRDPGYAALAAW